MKEIDWSKAPEGAQWYGARSDDYYEGWYKKRDDGKVFFCPINKETWVKTLGVLPDYVVPRQQWRGPEDGLPPVGTVCEKAPHWHKVEIIADHDRGIVIYDFHNFSYYKVGITTHFRPIKSERDKAIEDMLALDPSNGFTSRTDFCGILYDACYRKEPKQ